MAEIQLKKKIVLRRKEKPAEFTFTGLFDDSAVSVPSVAV